MSILATATHPMMVWLAPDAVRGEGQLNNNAKHFYVFAKPALRLPRSYHFTNPHLLLRSSFISLTLEGTAYDWYAGISALNYSYLRNLCIGAQGRSLDCLHKSWQAWSSWRFIARHAPCPPFATHLMSTSVLPCTMGKRQGRPYHILESAATWA